MKARMSRLAAGALGLTLAASAGVQVAAAAPEPGASEGAELSGRMYFDLTHLEQRRDGAEIAPSGGGFDVKRFYLGVEHRFDDTFSGALITDVQYDRAQGLTQVYVKKAYLQAKWSDAAIVRLGSADLPWIPFAEAAYGYRFVENTVADRAKFGTSADWGVHVLGRVAGGRIGYAVSVIDGAGYKNPVRSKSMDVEGRLDANLGKVVLAVGGYSGRLGKDVPGGPAVRRKAQRLNALAAYVDGRFRLGVEYFSARNWNNVVTAEADQSDGYSVFGAYSLTPKIAAFGRRDRVRPARTTRPSVRDDYLNLGLSWRPAKAVDLALVYKREKVRGGPIPTANGTIGGRRDGTYDEVGLFGQFRW